MPTISVIVPIYNTEKYLQRCIDSILAQTYTDIELLLIDDGSTDSSGRICDEYAQKDSRVRVFHKENGGVSSARNLGLNNAQGEYIGWVDSDDWIEPNMYEKMYECSKRTGADAVYCDINMVFKKHNDIYKAALHSASKSDFIKNYIATVWTVLWNTLVKTEIYRKNALLLPEHLCYCEDFWLSVRFFYFANMVSYVDTPLYNYNRMNEESITYSLNHKTEKNEREVYLETIDFFSKKGVLNYYKKELSWRILKSTYRSIYSKDEIHYFLYTYPESHLHIWSCPYFSYKTKTLLWSLSNKLKPVALFIIKIINIYNKNDITKNCYINNCIQP